MLGYRWYNKPESSNHYRDLYMKAINRLRYKSGLWKPVVEEGQTEVQGMHYKDRTFLFVNDVRKLVGIEPMTRKYFDEGWTCMFGIYDRDYNVAREMIWLYCYGDW